MYVDDYYPEELGDLGFRSFIKKARKRTKKIAKKYTGVVIKPIRKVSRKVLGKKLAKKISAPGQKYVRLFTRPKKTVKKLTEPDTLRRVATAALAFRTAGPAGVVAYGLRERQVRRQKKKYRHRTKRDIKRMEAKGASQKEIARYKKKRGEKLKHRRKKYQRGVRTAAIAAAAIAATVATGGGTLTAMGPMAGKIGSGVLTAGKTLSGVVPMAASLLRGNPGEYDISKQGMAQVQQANMDYENAYIAEQRKIKRKKTVLTATVVGGAGLLTYLLI